jgi:hypothetical protein
MAQEFVAGSARQVDTAQPVRWKSRRWGKASHVLACAGLLCSILVLSSTWNGVHVFSFSATQDPVASAEARIDLLGKYLALLALAVFLIGLGVIGYMNRAQE